MYFKISLFDISDKAAGLISAFLTPKYNISTGEEVFFITCM